MRTAFKRSDSTKRVMHNKRKAMTQRIKKKSNYDQILYRYQFPDTVAYLLENRRDVYATLAKLKMLQNQTDRNGYLAKANDILPKLRKMIAGLEAGFRDWLKECKVEKEEIFKGFIEFSEKKGMLVSLEEVQNLDANSKEQ